MITQNMAAVRKHYSTPDHIQLSHMEMGPIADQEILIKVHATTVNRTDCANLLAKPFIMRFVLGLFKPRKVILGTDFAGEIVQIGSAISNHTVGDRVMGFIDTGAESQSNYLKTSSKQIYRIPRSIDYQKAAASLEGAHYAHSFVKRSTIKPGQSILINGATGAIGSALLQFVREYDVHIAATCRTEHLETIKSLGADKVYDYTKEDFTQSKDQYDFIFDAVGKSTLGACRSVLKEKGVYISSELGPFAQNLFYAMTSRFRKKKVLFPVPFKTEETIPFIIEKIDQGIFNPLLDRIYPLEKIIEAYQYVLKGQKVGNVVLQIRK